MTRASSMTADETRRADAARKRKARLENPTPQRLASRRYYRANAEKCRARASAWKARHKAHVAAYQASRLVEQRAAQKKMRAKKAWLKWTRRIAERVSHAC